MVLWWKGKGYLTCCEGRERFQLSATNIELRFLGNIYMWGTNGIVGTILSEWACRLIMGNAKTKALMGKKSCLWLIGENLWAWNKKEMSESKWVWTRVVYL